MDRLDGVQCGWCPMLLPDDHDNWYQHFFIEHHYSGGYSVRHIRLSDWDISELKDTEGA
jgi:hypothetical protein